MNYKTVFIFTFICCCFVLGNFQSSVYNYPQTYNNLTSKDNNPGLNPEPLMSDEQFLGVWDSENSKWLNEGTINYSYSPKLASVENQVKLGQYEKALELLLEYYQNRDNIVIPDINRGSAKAAELFIDRFYGNMNQYITEFNLTNSYSRIEIDVTSLVKNGVSRFGLLARNKGESQAFFYSKESSKNIPELSVFIDGQKKIMPLVADLYVRGGKYAQTNYGTEENIIVSDSKPGFIVDDNTRKGYLKFDVSSLRYTSDIEYATLTLYGKTDAPDSEKAIVLIVDNESGLNAGNETSISWSQIIHTWLSYQSVEALQAWRNPPQDANAHHWFFIDRIVRFSYYKDIVYQFLKTDDEYYARSAIEISLEYIKYQMFNRLDSGIRTRTFVMPNLHLLNSESMTPRAWKIILEHSYMMGDWFYNTTEWFPNHNYGASQMAGATAISYYYPEFNDTAKWWKRHHDRIDAYTNNLFNPDFSFVEADTGYMPHVINNLNIYRDFAKLAGVSVPKDVANRFRGIARFASDVTDPSGLLYPYGDTYTPGIMSKKLIRSIAEDYNDLELMYIATDGDKGSEPLRTSVYYPDSFIAAMRTKWADTDALSLFVNARNGGIHWHPNTLSIFAYAYGRQLIDDTYYASSDPTDPLSRWTRENTSAHNTIEINHTAQLSTGDSGGSLVTNSNFDFFSGWTDANEGFRHHRKIFLSRKSKFWIVSDYISAPQGEHHYNKTWHPRPHSMVNINPKTKIASTNFPEGANISIVPADSGSLKANINDGWWVREANKYISYTKKAAGDVSFDTILFPKPEGSQASVEVQRIETDFEPTQATALKLKFTNANYDQAIYYLNHKDKPVQLDFDDYTFDGQMAYIQTDLTGALEVVSIKQGSMLESKNLAKPIFESEALLDDIGIVWKTDSIEISASTSSLADGVRLYCPMEISSLLINDVESAFVQYGDVVIVLGKVY